MKLLNYKLFGGDYIDELDRKILSNRILWIMLIAATLFAGLMAISYLSLASKVSLKAELPLSPVTEARSLEVGYGWASDFYFELYGRYFAELGGNFRKEEAKYKYSMIKKRLRPDVYAKYNPVIDKFTEMVLQNRIDMIFLPHTYETVVKADGKHGENSGKKAHVVVKGIAEVTVGRREEPQRECQFQFDMIMLGGRPYIEGFGQDCIGGKAVASNDTKEMKK